MSYLWMRSCLVSQKEMIALSDLVRVQACPVRYYYERDDQVAESDRYTVCKQVSCHLGGSLDAEVIWQEVLAIRPKINTEQRPFLDLCVAACRKKEWTPAVQQDVLVRSEKYGFVGMIDRVAADGTFSIIRAAGAMPFGTYAADRLRIAGIALCLEEMKGVEIAGGNVEYIPDGTSRHHEVQPRDRRHLIAALHKIREIRKGEMPEQPLNAPCGKCKYK
jgi:CRISPR-associated exonuclease Cas4